MNLHRKFTKHPYLRCPYKPLTRLNLSSGWSKPFSFKSVYLHALGRYRGVLNNCSKSYFSSKQTTILLKAIASYCTTIPTELRNLTGSIAKIIYQNDEGYVVISVAVADRRNMVVVTGNCIHLKEGQVIHATGVWIQHDARGPQFQARTLYATLPTSREGKKKYLCSLNGIGPAKADIIIKEFGDDCFNVIENDPERLTALKGFSFVTISKIQASWKENKEFQECTLFLSSHGIVGKCAARILQEYGKETTQKITENPYRLVWAIQGIGFKTADKIALSIGYPKDSPFRVQAGINFVLSEAKGSGNCGWPKKDVIRDCESLLEINESIVRGALDTLITRGIVIQDTIQNEDCIFTKKLYDAEKCISTSLLKLKKGTLPWNDIDEKYVKMCIQREQNFDLTTNRMQAFTQALTSKVMIITGGPGVGKTTFLRSYLTILRSNGVSIELAAPTGRAAKRLTEVTGLGAKTIHRLLEAGTATPSGFGRDSNNPLNCDIVVIDEASMLDVPLFFSLLQAIPETAALLLVGDPDQLPSVGPGKVLEDMIASCAFPCFHLTGVFRQGSSSKIISVARAVNQGNIPWPKLGDCAHNHGSDFCFFESGEKQDTLKKIIDLAVRDLPQQGYSPYHIQVLSPMSQDTLGTENLNRELQKSVNPSKAQGVELYGTTYRVGDKVMQTKNNYDKDIYNGDIGFIKKIDVENKTAIIAFDGNDIEFDESDMSEIVLGYALTIHKSQGSEYPAVIIALHNTHCSMLQRNLVYTAITHGKKLVIVVGHKRAFFQAVKNIKSKYRWSLLLERFQLKK